MTRTRLGVALLVAAGVVAFAPRDRITGQSVSGVVALIGSFAPRNDPFQGQFCGGVLVGLEAVATAAHCVANKDPADLAVLVGAGNLCSSGPITGRRIAVRDIAVDPAYDPSTAESDVAILTLAEAAGEPAREIWQQAPVPGRAVSYGWSPTGSSGQACLLHAIAFDIPSQATCPLFFEGSTRRFDAEAMVCAVPIGSVTSCHGDSGGPLIAGLDADQRGTVLAVASWGVGCEGPAVFARLRPQ